MKKEIFKILDEYNLLKSKNRTKILSSLSVDEGEFLLEKIQNSFQRNQHTEHAVDESLNLSIPYSSIDSIEQIPSSLFLFDKVYIADPLSDYLYYLTYNEEIGNRVLEQVKRLTKNKEILDAFLLKVHRGETLIGNKDEYLRNIRKIFVDEINGIIQYYVDYEELIDEGAIIPFVNIEIDYANTVEMLPIAMDTLLQKSATEFLSTIDKDLLSSQPTNELFTSWLFQKGIDIFETWRFVGTSFVFKEMFPASQVDNINLGGDHNKKYIDNLSMIAEKLLVVNTEEPLKISWPTQKDQVMFPVIDNVPYQELLNLRFKERDAILKYRYSVQQKLIDIKGSVGTNEYQNIVKKFSLEQKEKVVEISMLADHIQRNHLRKSSFQLTTTLFSAAGAILSAVTSIQNPLALVGTGIASAGFTAGISKLIETWISYKGEMDKLREKDSYILWKLHKNK